MKIDDWGVPETLHDYAASMEAFAAGQLDAVTMTNGDALVTGSTGAQSVMIIIGDYSNGNDMVVAAPGIKSVSELKGKRVGVEIGFVSHLLLLDALESVGLTEADVELVNVPTHEYTSHLERSAQRVQGTGTRRRICPDPRCPMIPASAIERQ